MSARQLRKLREKLQLEQHGLEAPQDQVEVEEEYELVGQNTKPFNPFDLLTDEDEQYQEEPSDNGVEELLPEQQHSPEHVILPQDKIPEVTQQSSNKKKNKKKKQQKKKQNQNVVLEKAVEGQVEGSAKNEEDIDQILQELNIAQGATQVQPSSSANIKPAFLPTGPLFQIDNRCLKPEMELRKIFGNQVVEEEEARAEAEQRRRLPRNARLPQLRKGILVNPKMHWPRPEGGLSMEHLGSNKFQYSYSASYTAVQELFEQYQQGFDPNNIVHLLHQSPYHLDSLLTLHDLYRATNEHSTAEDMLERCLFALETAWHPVFRPVNACTLQFESLENRPFFKATFKYLISLGRRGCHRTAMEFCKFVLKLDDEDPMGIVFCIDYYAIRANEFSWLVRFIQEYGSDYNYLVLPNILFSFALAKFKIWQSVAQQEEEQDSFSGFNADNQLLQAIFTFPMAINTLLEKLQELGVSGWAEILSRPLFSKFKGYGGSATLEHLVRLFVKRSHLLWKAPDVLLWLKKCCLDACNRYESGGQLLVGCTFEDWSMVRETCYPSSDENEYKHLRLEEFGDDLSAIPQEELQAAMGQGQGQAMEQAALEQEIRRLEEQLRQRVTNISEEDLRNSNPLTMLVRSLLPWVNAGQPPTDDNDDDQDQQQIERQQNP